MPQPETVGRMSENLLRVLPGDLVRVSSDYVEAATPSVSFASFRWPDGLELRFGSGAADYASNVAASDGVSLSRRYSTPPIFSGIPGLTGVLTFGDLLEDDIDSAHTEKVTMAAWQGEQTSVRTEMKSTDDFLASRFADFAMVESLGGLIMRPINPQVTVRREATISPTVNTYYTGLGKLEVFERTEQQEWRVPNWSGQPAAGGELYAETNMPASDGQPTMKTLLLAGDTALTRIYLYGELPESTVIARATALTVEWVKIP